MVTQDIGSNNGHNASFEYDTIEDISNFLYEPNAFLRKDDDGQCSFGEEIINALVF